MSIGLIIALVVLFVVVLVAYLGGVRQGAPWGTPLLVIGVVGLLGVVVYRMVSTGGGEDTQFGATDIQMERYGAAQLIGTGLKNHIAPGSRILLFGPDEPGFDLTRAENAFRMGLRKGLDDDTCEMAGYEAVPMHDVLSRDTFSEAIRAWLGEIEAAVSFVGLPEDFERLPITSAPDRPILGAYFPVSQETPDLSVIRGWLEDGKIEAVVVKGKGDKPKLYTP